MPRIRESDFVARHAFARLNTSEVAADPALGATVAAADVDNNGEIAGAPELSNLYRKLLSLDTNASAATGVDLDAPAVRPVYSALAVRFTQQAGVEAALGTKTLATVPELAAVAAGAVTMKRNGQRQLGMGSVQDALNAIAAAAEARTGQPSLVRVNLGANNANRGLFGPGSESAVRRFQLEEGLSQTGQVNAATLAALDRSLAAARAATSTTPTTPTTPANGVAVTHQRFALLPQFADVLAGATVLRAGERGPHVEVLQRALFDMGFPMLQLKNNVAVSGIDGVFGGQVTTALTNFQTHAKKKFPDVQKNGVLDAATLRALLQLAPAPGKKAWEAGQPNQAPTACWNGDATKPLRVVVAKDELRTFLYDRAGTCIGIFPNAHGDASTGNGTESGLKKVRTRLDEASAIATSQQLWGNANSFGKRIVDLSWADGTRSGEELHGTYDYRNMGKTVSHGCVRHYNEDIITIFDQLRAGEFVAICDGVDDPMLKAPASTAAAGTARV
jgi:peptidoglycan hydrolase-like protein with peptidoglycan-binding domain